MSSGKLGWMTIAPLALLVAVGGCCKKEQAQIQSLQEQYNDLSTQNQELRDELSACQSRESDLLNQLSSRTSELDATRQELQACRSSKATAPTPTDGQDWEVGIAADRVTVGSDILFASGKAELTSAGKERLNKIAADLQATYGGLPVRVVGYTDTDPIRKSKWKDNLQLSCERAAAVTRHLIDKGIKPDRISTIGMGEWHPVPNSKAKSRRVEIVAVKAG